VFDVSAALRESGWLVPAYTFPENRRDLPVLCVVVRNGFTHDLADLLMDDLQRALPQLRRQPLPVHDADSSSFAHGAGSPTACTTAPSVLPPLPKKEPMTWHGTSCPSCHLGHPGCPECRLPQVAQDARGCRSCSGCCSRSSGGHGGHPERPGCPGCGRGCPECRAGHRGRR